MVRVIDLKDVSDVDIEKLWREFDNSFDDVPDGKGTNWASFGRWRLVGNGVRTNGNCGLFAGFKGCLDVHAHGSERVDGLDFKGKGIVCLKHRSCFKPDCPVCYLSWANREAKSVAGRLEVLGRRYGLVEHVVVSLPESDYGLAEKRFDKLVVKVTKLVKKRGIFGGVLIFHGFRYADFEESKAKGVKFGWRWSPHFHIIGFVRFASKCRNCTVKCTNSCIGFYAQVSKWYSGWSEVKKTGRVVWHKGDGYVVNLKDKRKTVVGTAWYQLNHASLLVDVARFRVARWFGVCFGEKVTVVIKPDVCPICGRELIDVRYFGDVESRKRLSKDLGDCKKGDKRFFVDVEDCNGATLWMEMGSNDFCF